MGNPKKNFEWICLVKEKVSEEHCSPALWRIAGWDFSFAASSGNIYSRPVALVSSFACCSCETEELRLGKLYATDTYSTGGAGDRSVQAVILLQLRQKTIRIPSSTGCPRPEACRALLWATAFMPQTYPTAPPVPGNSENLCEKGVGVFIWPKLTQYLTERKNLFLQ